MLYVIAYSTCPFTSAFLHDWSGKLNGVEIRWVFYPTGQDITADNAADVALSHDPQTATEIVQHTHKSPSFHSSPASVSAYNNVVQGMDQLNRTFAQFGHYHVISPTFVWKNGSQVFVARGYEKGFFEKVILPNVRGAGA